MGTVMPELWTTQVLQLEGFNYNLIFIWVFSIKHCVTAEVARGDSDPLLLLVQF